MTRLFSLVMQTRSKPIQANIHSVTKHTNYSIVFFGVMWAQAACTYVHSMNAFSKMFREKKKKKDLIALAVAERWTMRYSPESLFLVRASCRDSGLCSMLSEPVSMERTTCTKNQKGLSSPPLMRRKKKTTRRQEKTAGEAEENLKEVIHCFCLFVFVPNSLHHYWVWKLFLYTTLQA